jgi:alkanesulfonate monooxygenase SsuD/methylene tetrahydromethanopterin reductase-like flavin-dependent oxidoreductase (luciferase family)
LPPPVRDFEKRIDPKRLALINNLFRHAVVGGPATIARGMADFIARYRPDEVIAVTQVFDPAARARSFEILSAALA